ncbi:hypothetical protein QR685DRAFT_449911, partial [Neurospora intermedia]
RNEEFSWTPLLAEFLLFTVDKKLQLAVPYAMQAGTRQGSGWRNETLPVPVMS